MNNLLQKDGLQQNAVKFVLFNPNEQVEALPLFVSHVRAGFPSPATDHIETRITLSEYLNGNPSTTFYVQLEGDSMIDFYMMEGDLLVIDRSMQVRNGDIVLAHIGNEYTVKLLEITDNGVRLVPGNNKYKPIEITEDLELLVWGVVRGVARRLRV